METAIKHNAKASSSAISRGLGDFQARLAEEGQEILDSKLARKISELDELCVKPEYAASRAKEIRKNTVDSLQAYFDECKRIEKKAEKNQAGGNPLMALFGGGGLSAAKNDDEEEEEIDEEDVPIALPQKLLLDKIALDNSNKVSLKLSLELDVPESKKRASPEEDSSDATNEPESKKAKTEKSESTEKSDEAETKDKEGEEKSEEKEEEEEEDEEPPIIQSNVENRAFANMLRTHIDEIVDWCTTIRAWLQSNISRNKNIGGADLKGEIQNEMMVEIQTVETELLNHKEIMAAYYVARAGILEKYVKSPEFEDYKVFVLDEDEKHWISLRAILIQMRNQTMTLYDAIQKESDELFSSGSGGKNESFAYGAMY